MKRFHWLAAVVLAVAPAAWGQENEAPAGEGTANVERSEHGKKQSTPDVIIEHVSDDYEYEFELPIPDKEPIEVHLGKIFSGLVFEAEPGISCKKPVSPSLMAFEGLMKFIGGCYDFRPTKSVLMMWIAAFLLLVFAFAFGRRTPGKLVPQGIGQNIIEVLFLYVREELAEKNIGKADAPRYTPYLASLFFFILFMNWLGLIPGLATATGNLAVTAALALCTFVLTEIASFRAAGVKGYFAHMVQGVPVALWPIMIPVELLGHFTKPIALTIRLFANMLAGHIVLFFMLGLMFMLSMYVGFAAVPMAIAVYMLEIFVGILQAYIFAMLSSLYIGMGIAMGHHEGGHEHHGAEHAH
jgi:F-type H+-transporting ATPase subunit a